MQAWTHTENARKESPAGAADVSTDTIPSGQPTFMLGVMLLSLVFSAASAFFQAGPAGAWLSTGVLALLLVGYTWKTQDAVLGLALVFGLVMGVGELASDYFAVVTTGTLVYPKVGPFLMASPGYMPLSWMVLMTQFVVVASAATQLWGLGWATLGLMLLGGLNIPLYEFLAARAGFWFYQDTPMLFGTTPWYVILGEVLVSAPLPWIARAISHGGVSRAVLWGLAQSLWVLLSSMVSFALVGR